MANNAGGVQAGGADINISALHTGATDLDSLSRRELLEKVDEISQNIFKKFGEINFSQNAPSVEAYLNTLNNKIQNKNSMMDSCASFWYWLASFVSGKSNGQLVEIFSKNKEEYSKKIKLDKESFPNFQGAITESDVALLYKDLLKLDKDFDLRGLDKDRYEKLTDGISDPFHKACAIFKFFQELNKVPNFDRQKFVQMLGVNSTSKLTKEYLVTLYPAGDNLKIHLYKNDFTKSSKTFKCMVDDEPKKCWLEGNKLKTEDIQLEECKSVPKDADIQALKSYLEKRKYTSEENPFLQKVNNRQYKCWYCGDKIHFRPVHDQNNAPFASSDDESELTQFRLDSFSNYQLECIDYEVDSFVKEENGKLCYRLSEYEVNDYGNGPEVDFTLVENTIAKAKEADNLFQAFSAAQKADLTPDEQLDSSFLLPVSKFLFQGDGSGTPGRYKHWLGNPYKFSIMENGALVQYCAWASYIGPHGNRKDTLNIQRASDHGARNQNNKIGYQIDGTGVAKSLYVDGSPKITLDAIGLNRVKGTCEAIIEEEYTEYKYQKFHDRRSKIQINVLLSDVVRRPDYHLRRLMHCIDQSIDNNHKHPLLDIKLIGDDLVKTVGVDAGGLSRAYLAALTKAYIENKCKNAKFESPSSGAPRPCTLQEEEFDSDKVGFNINQLLVPGLSQKEMEEFQRIGEFFVYCWQTNRYIDHLNGQTTQQSQWIPCLNIGKYFDESMFKVILSFTNAELDNAQTLTKKKIIELMECLFGADPIQQQLLAIYKLPDNQIDDIQLEHLFSKICQGEFDWEDGIRTYDVAKGTFDFNATKARQNLKNIREVFILSLYRTQASEIAPLWAIARGIRSGGWRGTHMLKNWYDGNQSWTNYFTNKNPQNPKMKVTPKIFSDSLQGSLDRVYIASQIDEAAIAGITNTSQKAEVQKKVDWIKEFITGKKYVNSQPVAGSKAECKFSEKQLSEFMQYVTGAPALTMNKKVKIGVQALSQASPFYPVHTCSQGIDIAPISVPQGKPNAQVNDHTRKGLFDALIVSMKTKGFQNQ